MNLIDENRNTHGDNRKIFIACGVGIVVLLFIIIGLLAYVTTINKNSASLIVDNQKYSVSSYLLNKDNVTYIGIEDLTKMTKDGYSYKSGSKDVEDENKCYITNSYESTFFEVGSKDIYKVLEDTNETEYYTLENPIIKENGKIYMPIDSARVAANVSYSNNKNKIVITSISSLEGFYNKQKSNTFIPDTSIVWETIYPNKKLLKDGLVIIKDENSKLGLATISSSTDSKTKVTKVTTNSVIDPKYNEIKYVEKYNQLIVKTDKGKGIVQIEKENGNFSAKTVISPQYSDIKQISDELYLVSNTSTEKNNKYGIIKKSINQSSSQEAEEILPIEYEKIGIDISKFTNNKLNNEYIIYDSLIPVKKDNLWGFVNLKGKVVVKLEYTGLGYISTNSSSNVFIIPELNAIVVKKDKDYSIITKSNKVLINGGITKVYKETVNGKEQYSMIYNEKKQNVIEYVNNSSKNTNNTQNKNNVNSKNKNTTTTTTTNNNTNSTTNNNNTNATTNTTTNTTTTNTNKN